MTSTQTAPSTELESKTQKNFEDQDCLPPLNPTVISSRLPWLNLNAEVSAHTDFTNGGGGTHTNGNLKG